MIVDKMIRRIIIGCCLIAFVLPVYMILAAPLPYQTYLPIIVKQSEVIPTPQPTPAPVLFPNGDFEQGPVIWGQVSYNGWALIYQQKDLPQGVFPYDGKWVAWLGGDINETAYIEQQVFVASNLPYMSLFYWIVPSAICGTASLGMVMVDGAVVATYALCNATGGWIQSVIDLSAYAARSVTIQIRAECDSITTSDLFVDHVALQASQNGASHLPEVITDIHDSTMKKDVPGK